ncbi:MAG TPA: sigma-54 dependent transcriptional regulator [Pirellulales bacterium]|nr:sigma-54 dependent transcriptional regulator [Pirellulales bacterium]
MAKILVVDDERTVLRAFEEILPTRGHEVVAVRGAEEAMRSLKDAACDLVLMDIRLPGMNGLDALARIKEMHPALPVIVMTGRSTTHTAIEATKRGAFDYQLKPFEPSEMLKTISAALEASRLMKGHVALGPQPAEASTDAIVGQSPAMRQLYKAIGHVAPTDVTVLIRGESGTGKELVARAIYEHSRRSQQPLIVINCAAIPETLLESELFGYEQGAFTGATSRRIGKFEQAHRGTIFLDEIGDIPLMVQAKILRVLQEQTFQPLGGNETIRADVRVLCATNRDLEKAISEGQFREDLYHRLNVVTVQLPPLRDRREDIPLLVDYFLNRCARAAGGEKPPLAADALESLVNYAWPGNVRELEHLVQRLIIFSGGYTIQRLDLPWAQTTRSTAAGDEKPYRQLVRAYLDSYSGERAHADLMETIERLLIVEALRRSEGNQTHAAQRLHLPRPTLHAKMQKLGILGRGENEFL